MPDTAGEVKTNSFDIFLWTPSYGRAKVGWPAKTYIQQFCADTGYRLEDLPGVIDNRDRWQERIWEICAGGAIWWWWYIYIYTLLSTDTVSLYHNSLVWLTCKMLQAGIKNQLIFHQLDILTLTYCHFSVSKGIFKLYIHIRLSATKVLNSWEELCIYIYIYIYIHFRPN